MTTSAKGAILTGTLLFLFPVAVLPQTFDAERAFGYLRQQCNLGTREPNSNGHKAAKDWLETSLHRIKGEYRRVNFTWNDTHRKKTLALTNFHVLFKGQSQKRILFCAHWDCRPWADRDPIASNRSLPVLGANDGASGTAVLLELCGLLSSRPPEKSVEIIFFDGEDYGTETNPEGWCLGSKHFAKSARPSDYTYAVLIDMIGDRDLSIRREQRSQANAPIVMDQIWSLAAAQGCSAFVDRTGYAIYDDHVPLIEKGIPAVDLIDLDYPYWHTISDTPDKCSAQSLGQVGNVLEALIYE
ncbi:MAG: M28 family peptidase [Fibrobacterota bacterium]